MGRGKYEGVLEGKREETEDDAYDILSSSPSFKKTTIFTLHQFPWFSNSEFSNGKS